MRSWGNVLRRRIFLRGSAASGADAGFGLQRSHREFGPRQKPASWHGLLVSPSQRHGILRPDAERAELLAWLPASNLRAGDEKTNLRELGRTIQPYTAGPMHVLDPVHRDTCLFQFRSSESQGFRIGIQPEHFSARTSPLYENSESAGSAAQVEDSVSVLNARLPE